MTKKKFWDELSKRVPDAVQKAIEVIEKIIKGLKAKVSKSNRTEKYITDLEKGAGISLRMPWLYISTRKQRKMRNYLSLN